VANGYRSRVDVFKERYPGLSTQDALSDLRRIAREEAIVASGAVDEDVIEAVDDLEAAAEALREMPMEHAEAADALELIQTALAALRRA